MTIIRNIDVDIDSIGTTNQTYIDYRARWTYLLESYLGGQEYRAGRHLTRYQLETDQEYQARLNETPVDNHCRSVISVYNSFLFRTAPKREFGSLEDLPELEAFLRDADLDGRDLDSFMKDASTWANVFGHCWIMVSKPNIQARTRADELAAEVRPYLSLMTPLVVLDWSWRRMANGRFVLDALKYIEEVNGSIRTYKQWSETEIRTWTVDLDQGEIQEDITEPNQLGSIPAVILYANRSMHRGIGISNITDIADAQRFIYNATSEVAQSIRLDSHPSLVKTPETQAGIGAGSIISMPENLDGALKPYLLEYSGASVSSIYESIRATIDSIDKMANTGAVRATEARRMSGVAMETEFQLLNAKLSEMADNIELAEEQIWKLWCLYQGQSWTGTIDYPGSFNIRDTSKEIDQLLTAKNTATDARVLQLIDHEIIEWLGEDADLIMPELESESESESEEEVLAAAPVLTHPSLAGMTAADRQAHIQDMLMSGISNAEILRLHPEVSTDEIVQAGAAAARAN